jgi:hypothetical protein
MADTLKPNVVEAIQILTFLLSLMVGGFAVLFTVAMGVGGAGNPNPRDFNPYLVGYATLFFATAGLSFITIFVSSLRRTYIWFSLIGYWVFLMIAYIPMIFVGDPFTFIGRDALTELARANSIIYQCISLAVISYSLACIICFQTKKVKAYFGFKIKQETVNATSK